MRSEPRALKGSPFNLYLPHQLNDDGRGTYSEACQGFRGTETASAFTRHFSRMSLSHTSVTQYLDLQPRVQPIQKLQSRYHSPSRIRGQLGVFTGHEGSTSFSVIQDALRVLPYIPPGNAQPKQMLVSVSVN